MIDKILDLLDKLGPILYVLVPAVYTVYYKTLQKTKNRKKELIKQNQEKAKELYDIWEHEESQRIIKKVQDLCNYYKDTGTMDSVSYIQIENGTVAKSKLCNMFVSCLAEDNRFGRLSKYMSRFQRVPYSRVASWMTDLMALEDNDVILTPNSLDLGPNAPIRELSEDTLVESSIIAPVYAHNGILLGACIFLYAKKDYNKMPVQEQQTQIHEFKIALESIFLEYYVSRVEKKKELNIGGI